MSTKTTCGYDGDTIELEAGWTATVTTQQDDYQPEPWKECDGHGDVTGWLRRKKYPGELVVCSDRGAKRYYDFAGAVELARKDGWGCSHGRGTHKTPGEVAACATRRDFEYCGGWCQDEWTWIVVTVTVRDSEGEVVHVESVGGVESLGGWKDVAMELLSEAINGSHESRSRVRLESI